MEKEKVGNKKIEKEFIICKHCGKQIKQARLIGFSLICPLCKKPQNGH